MTHEKLAETLLPILYEDDSLLAIDKPAGIDTGGLEDQSARGVIEILATLRGDDEKLVAANRLSRYESGVLVLAKNPAIARHIRTGLRTMRIAQQYAIVVLGKMTQSRMVIGLHRGASRGKHKGTRHPSKPTGGVAQTGTAATQLQLLCPGPKRSLVKCTTHAPTTHALKAQLRSQRLRAIGDVVQSSTARPMTLQMTCLHLTQLEFHNPNTHKKMILRSHMPESFEDIARGARDVTRVLHAGLTRRLACVTSRTSNAWRLLSGGAEDVPGVTAEIYDDIVVIEISAVRDTTFDLVTAAARWYRKVLQAKAVYVRLNVRGSSETISRLAASLPADKPIVGEATPPEAMMTESGLKFLVRPWEGPSVGLYLDHRDNRRRVRAMARDKDVLNLFAYTCGFSLAAAMGGARSSVSVDLASPALDWGRRNFELNGLSSDIHAFVKADATGYLKRATRDKKLFDLIILDPPSFAHGKKRGQTFSIARDLPDLVRAATAALREGGTIMVSTNLRKMSHRTLRTLIKEGATGRRHQFVEKPPLPDDFSVDPDHAKTFFVKFD